LSSSNNAKNTGFSKKIYFQSQTKKHVKPNFQSSLCPPAPSLQFQRQQQKSETKKDSAEQQMENKRSLYNTKENIGKYMENTVIQYPLSNTDKLIDYYRQTTESLRELSFDNLKLQKDYIDAFQPMWIKNMKKHIDNYLDFKDKMIMLYNQMCNGYLKNIYNTKTNKEKEGRI
jgi:hypothetical protein